jgi:hypothetical protein
MSKFESRSDHGTMKVTFVRISDVTGLPHLSVPSELQVFVKLLPSGQGSHESLVGAKDLVGDED